MPDTLEVVEKNLEAVSKEPSPEGPAELIADTGYHSRGGLRTCVRRSVWRQFVDHHANSGDVDHRL